LVTGLFREGGRKSDVGWRAKGISAISKLCREGGSETDETRQCKNALIGMYMKKLPLNTQVGKCVNKILSTSTSAFTELVSQGKSEVLLPGRSCSACPLKYTALVNGLSCYLAGLPTAYQYLADMCGDE
jgi:hypothetical protein